ncbi:hypothetical protein OHB05_35445 [Streptomyces sp. NBC_00638]|uniref:hypothetical protein n=1 Tax=unclassified Streptomyces TaxID=2593676 RepID=UPI002258EED5|nr:hypothetical protein [Streptomyces sp. NBC_00638]MCX5007879.1 hypothetical protein [Streptomyces sp. NBC_00638]
MIALVSAGAISLAMSGYAVGAARHDGASEQSTTCEQANQDFAKRAGQFRKQKHRAAQGGETLRQSEIGAARMKILSMIVVQNPTCFGAGTRATAAVLRQHPSEGQEDAAVCELAGVPSRDCTITVD